MSQQVDTIHEPPPDHTHEWVLLAELGPSDADGNVVDNLWLCLVGGERAEGGVG